MTTTIDRTSWNKHSQAWYLTRCFMCDRGLKGEARIVSSRYAGTHYCPPGQESSCRTIYEKRKRNGEVDPVDLQSRRIVETIKLRRKKAKR